MKARDQKAISELRPSVAHSSRTLFLRHSVSLAAEAGRGPAGEAILLLRKIFFGSLSPGRSPRALLRTLSSTPPGG